MPVKDAIDMYMSCHGNDISLCRCAGVSLPRLPCSRRRLPGEVRVQRGRGGGGGLRLRLHRAHQQHSGVHRVR